MKTRVIPVLLLRNKGLVKTVQFKGAKYIGDPINSIRIFNEKEVDEVMFLDISATPEVAYGGGISNMEQIEKILTIGFEKVILNSSNYLNIQLVEEAVSAYGSQAIVGCLDVQRNFLGRYELYSHSGTVRQALALEAHATILEEAGVGEILVNNIKRDGTQKGYDLDLIRIISSRVSVPVVACGGAGSLQDFADAVEQGGASAVAAGSLFVFKGKHRAVLINYPNRKQLSALIP
jgi:cyclase